MVRFIPESPRTITITLHKSQFHYGSIHTGKTRCYSRTDKCVSIPLWFDSYISPRVGNRAERCSLNSTMVRFILKERVCYYMKETRVSIPLWFDSYEDAEIKYVIDKESQFHYGSIHTNHYGVGNTYTITVSIPLWFDSYDVKL